MRTVPRVGHLHAIAGSASLPGGPEPTDLWGKARSQTHGAQRILRICDGDRRAMGRNRQIVCRICTDL